MRRAQLCANIDQGIFGNPEFSDPLFGLNLGLGEMSAHGLANTPDLTLARAQLHSRVSISIEGALGNDLTLVNV
jgi:hypothetical protein